MQRYPIFDVASPLRDLVFYEVVDYNIKTNRDMEYGTPHHNGHAYPNHKLVYITPNDKEGKTYRFYYAAARENQDEYNYTTGYESIGGILLKTVVRTYVSLREAHIPFNPTIGGAMPLVPTGKFESGFVLHKVAQVKATDELDSIFVFEQYTYIKPATADGKEYGKIITVNTSTQALVTSGASPVTGINVIESTVTPLGNGQSVINTQSVSGGWPAIVEHALGKSSEGLIPAKFRKFVTVETKTNKLAEMPENIGLTGNEISRLVKKETPDRYDQSITLEQLDEEVSPLTGEEYGNIVTFSTSETLVVDGTAADSGLNIISSVVSPLGNGKSIKETKSVKGGAWPDPINVEFGKEPNSPPAKYRDYVSRKKFTKKVSSIPENIVLSGNEVGKTYTKETPDRAEETIITEDVELTISDIDEQIDQKPFVTIKTIVRPGEEPELPLTGNGSSALIYRSGNLKIYENSREEATARVRFAGEDKDEKPFVTISTTKRYDVNNNINTTSGTANVVFDDGDVTVYEINEVTAQGKTRSAGIEKDVKPFVILSTEKKYAPNGDVLSPSGTSNIVYDNGTTVVFEVNEITATARERVAGEEKDKKPFVEISTQKRYSSNGAITTGTGTSNIVFDDGEAVVFEINETTATARERTAGEEIDKKPFVELVTQKRYSVNGLVTTGTGSSNIVFDDGNAVVFEVNETTATARVRTAGEEKDKKPFVELATAKRYATSGDVATPTGSSNIVYDDGDVTVFEVNETTATAKVRTAGEEIEKRPFAHFTTTKRYATSGNVGTPTGSSSIVFDDGAVTVFEVNETTAAINAITSGTEKDKRPFVTLTTTKSYSSSPDVSGDTGSSNVVYSDGTTTVYEINNTTAIARIRAAGEEKDKKPFVELITTKRYDTDGTVDTETGSSNIIYDDGSVTVFEVNETNAIARVRTAGQEKDKKPFIELTTTKRYDTDGTVDTATGSSNIVYDDGNVTVFEINEIEAQARVRVAGQEKDKKPFVEFTTTKRYATDGTVDSPTGSSNIIYDNGDVTVFEVNEIAAQARVRTAGQEKDKKPFIEFTTTKRYDTNGTVNSPTGSSNVVYDDGDITVFEVNEIEAQARTRTVGEEIDIKPFVELTTTKKYATSNTIDAPSGSSNVIYDDGDVTVFEVNEVTAEARIRTVGEEKDERPFVTLKTTKKYSSSSTVTTNTGASNVVFDDGETVVFEVNEVTAVPKTGPAGQEKEKRTYVEITTNKSYETSGDINGNNGKSNVIYNDGDVTVYEVDNVSSQFIGGTKGVETKAQSWGAITEVINYQNTSDANPGGSTSVVYNDGDTTVYESTNVSVTISGGTIDTDSMNFGTVTWTGAYSSSPAGARSRQVWSNGVNSVYLNESPSVEITATSFTSGKKKTAYYTETEVTSYGTASVATGDNSSSRIVYNQAGIQVFENTETVISPSTVPRIYGSVVPYSIPSVLYGFNIYSFPLRKGGSETHFSPIIEEGYEGSFPCEVTEYYTENPTAPSLGELQPFKPAPVAFTLPWCSVNVGPTLHQTINIFYSTGTKDPRYKFTSGNILIPATSPPNIEAGRQILARIESSPFNNGFIVREYRITL